MTGKVFLRASPLLLTGMLAACGGGGDAASSANDPALVTAPTVYTSDGRPTQSCAWVPACSSNPHAPFAVTGAQYNTTLPPDGAILSGFVRFQVGGLAMENVELLPATGYDPKVGVFGLSGDKTNAWLDFDTMSLPNGPVRLRISAFNAPAGQPDAVERQAMPSRLFYIDNPAPRAALTASLAAAPANGAVLSRTTRLEVRGTGLANVELLPGQGYKPSYGQFNVSPDRTRAWLDFDPRTLPDGARDMRISAFNVTAGQPGAREVVAMAPRRWQMATNSTSAFTSGATSAPVHGANVRGIVVLEVRGTGMRNVELLPSSGYAPKHGQFRITNNGTFAYLNFDTRDLPNGPITVRIAAFNAPAGQAGREITAMPSRQWMISN
jgi:hypothetical protein